MSPHLPPEAADEAAEQNTLDAGQPPTLDEFDQLDEPDVNDVDEWPDPEGWPFYLTAEDEPPELPDQEPRYPELETPF